MKKVGTAVTKKWIFLALTVSLSIAVATSVSAIEIPKGKSGGDYVKEAKAHVKGLSSKEANTLMESTDNAVLLDIRSFAEFKQHGWIQGRTFLPHGMVIFNIKK